MDDRMLTRLLDASAPPTAESAERDAAVQALVADRVPSRTGRSRALTVTAITSAIVLGGATAAAAGTGLLTHLGWWAENSTVQETRDGTLCTQGFRVSATPERVTDPAALEIARDALVTVDLDSLDLTETLRELEGELANTEYVEGGEPWTPTTAFTDQFALFTALNEHIRDAVADAGYDPDSVSLDGAAECDRPLITPAGP
ncbi:MAG: hypothetical protein ACLGH5_09390 [Actinomycetes bacterium]